MEVKVFDLAFYFKDDKTFRCDSPRRCPRYVLYKKTGIHHQRGLKMIDAVMEAMIDAAAKVFSVGERTIIEQTTTGTWVAIVPTDARGLPVVAVPVLSASAAHNLNARQQPNAEDVLIAGWYSQLHQGKVCHIHYVQPKTLYYFSQTLKPFYRPFFVSTKNEKVSVNMGLTSYSPVPVVDGIQELFGYFNRNQLPDRPKGLDTPKKSPCLACPYDPLCHLAEKQDVHDLKTIADLVLPPEKQ